MSNKDRLLRESPHGGRKYDSDLLLQLEQRWGVEILNIFAQLRNPENSADEREIGMACHHRTRALEDIKDDLVQPLIAGTTSFRIGALELREARINYGHLSFYEYHRLAVVFHACGALYWMNLAADCRVSAAQQEIYVPYCAAERRRNEFRALCHDSISYEGTPSYWSQEIEATDRALLTLVSRAKRLMGAKEGRLSRKDKRILLGWDLHYSQKHPTIGSCFI